MTRITLILLLLAYFIPVNLLGSHTFIPVTQTTTLALFLLLKPRLTAPEQALGVAIGFSSLMIVLTIFAIVVDFEKSIYRDYAELLKYGLILIAFISGTFMSNDRNITNKIIISFTIGASFFAVIGLSESIFRNIGEIIG